MPRDGRAARQDARRRAGALAPERIIITPNARLVVVDHMLGASVERLGYSHDRYWKELRIPLPTAAQPTFDFRADVMQIGMVALALILGRPLDSDDYPDQVAALAEGAGIDRHWRRRAAPARTRTWLSRMLQLDPRHSFVTAVEAWSELEHVLGTSDYVASFGALKSFMAEYARYSATAAASPAAAPAAPAPAAPPVVPAAPPAASVAAPSRPIGANVGSSQSVPTSPAPAPVAAAARPRLSQDRRRRACSTCAAGGEAARSSSAGAGRRRSDTHACQCSEVTGCSADTSGQGSGACLVAATGFATTSAATGPMTENLRAVAAAHAVDHSETREKHGMPWRQPPCRRGRRCDPRARGRRRSAQPIVSLSSASAEAPGTLTVSTNPAGVPVVIDGEPRGVTPLTLELAPGRRETRLAANGGSARVIPLTICRWHRVAVNRVAHGRPADRTVDRVNRDRRARASPLTEWPRARRR